MSKFLISYKFKKWGAFMFPCGLLLFGLIHLLGIYKPAFIAKFNIIYWQIALVVSFFSSLIGLLLLVFSKEKNEDEYINKLRLESFQVAAIAQLVYLIYSFVRFAFYKGDNDKEYMVFMFSRILLVFWLAYIIRYNLILAINRLRIRNEK